MKYIFVDESWEDYLYWQKTNKKMLKRINDLLTVFLISYLFVLRRCVLPNKRQTMKRILCVLLFFLSTVTNAQELISDSLVYSLTLRTINEYTREKIKILKQVEVPSQLWDENNKGVKLGNIFKESDIDFIKSQIKNPVIRSWNTKEFNRKQNLKLTKRVSGGLPFFGLHGKENLIISLPIFSKSLDTAVIYYQSWNKLLFYRQGSGAGYVAVWIKNQNGEWIMNKNDMWWITKNKKAAHNKAQPLA